MKILVPIKRVVDPYARIRVKPDGSGVDLTHVKMSMNPFDEIAVEESVRLKEKQHVTEIVVVSIGSSASSETLRTALAMGGDRGILIRHDTPLEPLTVAKILKELVLKEKPQLVLMGKQAIDDDCNQTGQMLAGLLGWSQGTFISEMRIDGDHVDVVREVDGGLQSLRLRLPSVLTTDLRLNTPRYASLPNIIKAKKKPIEEQNLETYSVDLASRLTILNIQEPVKRKAGVKVSSVSELLMKLKSEAGVL